MPAASNFITATAYSRRSQVNILAHSQGVQMNMAFRLRETVFNNF
jgi:hypothetical protein